MDGTLAGAPGPIKGVWRIFALFFHPSHFPVDFRRQIADITGVGHEARPARAAETRDGA